MPAQYATHLFTPADARELTGVTEGQYRYWISEGIVHASVRDERDRPYGRIFSFADLVTLRAIKLLRDEGLPLDELRKVQPWVWEHLDTKTLQVRGCLYVVDGGLLDERGASSGAKLVDFGGVVQHLVWKIEHRRELNHQIGRIECSPRIQGGEPVVAGTRVPVATLKSFASAGYSIDEIRRQYPQLTVEDVRAALSHVAEPSDMAVAV